jgi:O-antigen/teichoic acid export membrane protein
VNPESGLDHRIRLVKNTAYSGATTSAGLLLFALMILAGRSLGSNDFGIFSFALSLASLFAIVTDFGLDDLVVREVARDRRLAGECFGNIIVWKTLLSVCALAALVITVDIMKSSSTIRVVTYLLGMMAILRSFITTVRAFFRSFERFDLESALVVTDRVLLFGVAAACLLTGKNVIALAVVFTGVRLVTILIALILFHIKVAPIAPRFDLGFIRSFQLQAMPFGFAFLCFGLYTYLDKIILSLARSEVEVGLYNAGYQIYEGLMIIPTILAAVLYPRFSRLFVSDPWRQRELFSRGTKYLMIIALPLAVGGLLRSEEILSLLFGSEFLPAGPALSILLCGVVLSFQNVLLHTYLNSVNRQRTMLLTTLAGLCLALIMDILLIPRYGIIGAAVAAIGYVVTIFGTSYWAVRSQPLQASIVRAVWRPLLAALAMGAVFWKTGSIPVAAAMVLAIALYVFLLFIMRVFDRQELELAKGFLGRIFSRSRPPG